MLVKLSYVQHVPGHKDSKGEAAPWVVKSHSTGEILSSHKTEAEARAHLKQMQVHKHMKADKKVPSAYLDLHFGMLLCPECVKAERTEPDEPSKASQFKPIFDLTPYAVPEDESSDYVLDGVPQGLHPTGYVGCELCGKDISKNSKEASLVCEMCEQGEGKQRDFWPDPICDQCAEGLTQKQSSNRNPFADDPTKWYVVVEFTGGGEAYPFPDEKSAQSAAASMSAQPKYEGTKISIVPPEETQTKEAIPSLQTLLSRPFYGNAYQDLNLILTLGDYAYNESNNLADRAKALRRMETIMGLQSDLDDKALVEEFMKEEKATRGEDDSPQAFSSQKEASEVFPYGLPKDKGLDDWMAKCNKCGQKFWASQGGVQHYKEYEGASEQPYSACPNCGADSAFWEDLGDGTTTAASSDDCPYCGHPKKGHKDWTKGEGCIIDEASQKEAREAPKPSKCAHCGIKISTFDDDARDSMCGDCANLLDKQGAKKTDPTKFVSILQDVVARIQSNSPNMDVAKRWVLDAVQASNIDQEDKDTIIRNVEDPNVNHVMPMSMKDQSSLVGYLFNSILKYKGLGVIKKKESENPNPTEPNRPRHPEEDRCACTDPHCEECANGEHCSNCTELMQKEGSQCPNCGHPMNQHSTEEGETCNMGTCDCLVFRKQANTSAPTDKEFRDLAWKLFKQDIGDLTKDQMQTVHDRWEYDHSTAKEANTVPYNGTRPQDYHPDPAEDSSSGYGGDRGGVWMTPKATLKVDLGILRKGEAIVPTKIEGTKVFFYVQKDPSIVGLTSKANIERTADPKVSSFLKCHAALSKSPDFIKKLAEDIGADEWLISEIENIKTTINKDQQNFVTKLPATPAINAQARLADAAHFFSLLNKVPSEQETISYIQSTLAAHFGLPETTWSDGMIRKALRDPKAASEEPMDWSDKMLLLQNWYRLGKLSKGQWMQVLQALEKGPEEARVAVEMTFKDTLPKMQKPASEMEKEAEPIPPAPTTPPPPGQKYVWDADNKTYVLVSASFKKKIINTNFNLTAYKYKGWEIQKGKDKWFIYPEGVAPLSAQDIALNTFDTEAQAKAFADEFESLHLEEKVHPLLNDMKDLPADYLQRDKWSGQEKVVPFGYAPPGFFAYDPTKKSAAEVPPQAPVQPGQIWGPSNALYYVRVKSVDMSTGMVVFQPFGLRQDKTWDVTAEMHQGMEALQLAHYNLIDSDISQEEWHQIVEHAITNKPDLVSLGDSVTVWQKLKEEVESPLDKMKFLSPKDIQDRKDQLLDKFNRGEITKDKLQQEINRLESSLKQGVFSPTFDGGFMDSPGGGLGRVDTADSIFPSNTWMPKGQTDKSVNEDVVTERPDVFHEELREEDYSGFHVFEAQDGSWLIRNQSDETVGQGRSGGLQFAKKIVDTLLK